MYVAGAKDAVKTFSISKTTFNFPTIRRPRSAGYLLHNRVRLIRGGREYFDLLIRLINEASNTIHLQFYIFEEDDTGTSVSDALIDAAKRGVKVYLLVDAFGSQGLSREFVGRLVESGVKVRRFQPLFKSRRFYFGRRLHHKVVVVDARHSLVSGLNIGNRYNDVNGVPAWLDWALYVEGEVAPALEDVCRRRLRMRLPKGASGPPPDTEMPVRIRINDWIRRKREIFRSYLEMFRNAESHITIMSAYFLPGRLFRRKIVAARKRGVRIRVILTADADVVMIKYAERYIYRWLFKHGIEVYEYRRSIVHGKMAMYDDKWMTIGSYNVNNLSAYGSIELNLDVNDPAFVKKVGRTIDALIESDCVPITEKTFRKNYNYFNFLVHKTAYILFRFLFFLSTKKAGD